MQVLDSTIANVSIPTIAGDLGISTGSGHWVITSFTVANGISLPLTGWLMQRFGIVRTSVFAILMFTAASFLCGIAWNLPSLLAFRVLQGAVSGPMIPGSQALLLRIFPPQLTEHWRSRSGRSRPWWRRSSGQSLAAISPTTTSWPWIFLINLPVGLLERVYLLALHSATGTRRPANCR